MHFRRPGASLRPGRLSFIPACPVLWTFAVINRINIDIINPIRPNGGKVMNQPFKTISGYIVWGFAFTLIAAGCGSMGGDNKGSERTAKSEAPARSEAAAKGQTVKVSLSG